MSTSKSGNKGKEIAEKEEKIDPGRAFWTDAMRKAFLDLCVAQVQLSGKPGVNFSTTTWGSIIKEFAEQTGFLFNQKQLRNQLDLMKQQYNAWVTLNKQTGLGRNKVTGAITMQPERWVEYLKGHKDAKIFQSKPLLYAEEMEILFKDTTTRGEERWTPSSGSLPEDVPLHDDTGGGDVYSLGSPTPEVDPKSVDVEEVEAEDVMKIIRRKRPKPSKSRRQSINEETNSRIDSVLSLIEEEKKASVVKVPTITDCVASLYKIDGLDRRSASFQYTLRSFRKPENREISMALPEDEDRITWIEESFFNKE